MNSKALLTAALLGLLIAACTHAAPDKSASAGADGKAARPNILLILADDLGYADVSFNVQGKAEIPTPNLDKLAHTGLIFTSAYVVHPFCGPSRMGLMTGRYPHEYGGPFNLPDYSSDDYRNRGVPTSETLISTVLHDAGYFTGAMGKWHMGQAAEFHPHQRGFDEFYGFLGGGHNYFGPFKPQNAQGTVWDYAVHPDHNGVPDTSLGTNDYMTDVLTAKGIDFLNTAAKGDRPFFLYMAYNAPHTPLEAKQQDMDQFPNLTGDRKIYAGMVHALDRGVSNLVAALEANGQFDNTLIIFLSDNGGRTDEGAKNLPLRGHKGDTWEGGFRVPMFWEWPNVIPAGKKYEYPVTALDFYPTFARLAKATIPAGKKLEGKNILDDIIAGRNARAGEPIYAVRYNVGFKQEGYTQVGIREDQWKAVRAVGSHTWQLFDIANDIGEKKDVSASHPDIVSNLVTQAKAWATNTHVTPLWYDTRKDETEWKNRGMPHYDTTFFLP